MNYSMGIDYVQLMKLAGNTHRLVLLLYLATRERTMEALVRETSYTETNICYHLKRFRDKGLIHGRRRDHQLFYSLVDQSGEISKFLFFLAKIYATPATTQHTLVEPERVLQSQTA